jgi:hypothetical protein
MLLTSPIIRLTILLIGMPTVTVGLLARDAVWRPVSLEELEQGAVERRAHRAVREVGKRN